MTSRPVRRASLALLFAAAAGCASEPPADAARRRNREFVEREGDAAAAKFPGRFLVVQGGALVAQASLPDDAIRVADRRDPDAPHRFVYRPEDRGERLYRMAILPSGGRVAGRGLFTELGLDVAAPPGGTGIVLLREGRPFRLAAAESGTLRIEVASLDRRTSEVVTVAVDPDFDGGLLLDAATGARLRLERQEVPGAAEVQVALGRPFAARRARVLVRIPEADVRGVVEALVEAPPERPGPAVRAAPAAADPPPATGPTPPSPTPSSEPGRAPGPTPGKPPAGSRPPAERPPPVTPPPFTPPPVPPPPGEGTPPERPAADPPRSPPAKPSSPPPPR